jgi:GNAT superfamily N-acetyltransferase
VTAPASPRSESAGWTLRAAGREDYGWIVERHRELYQRERGWDDRFVALVAAVVDDFEREQDPALERGWIAELGGRRVGSVLLVRHPERPGVAKLRLLLVEPEARGLGIGARLMAECTAFARAAGYRAITLWTSSVLDSARRLYEAEGYRLVCEEAEELFHEGELGQEWELAL